MVNLPHNLKVSKKKNNIESQKKIKKEKRKNLHSIIFPFVFFALKRINEKRLTQ